MCGIAGFVDYRGLARGAALDSLVAMTAALAHRGPDDSDVFVDRCVALGHRRLAIIDVAGGRQPMGAAGGAVRIVFNGEIYNHRALRAELASRGHLFATGSDTEAILVAYLEWGDACVTRLNGMFAFALWDARTGRLLLARDRVGEKPLYYARTATGIAFASELEALRAGGWVGEGIDPEALDCYFTLGYVPAPRTIRRGASKLRAAHTLVVTEGGVQERRYWSLGLADVHRRSLDDAVDEFEPLFADAVRMRLESEVPLGAFLSGGIDSSLVVSAMAAEVPAVKTHTIGFDDARMDEVPVARATARHLGTDHRELVVRPAAADVLPTIAAVLDEPLADASALPTWHLAAMTRRSVTVALSGDGGDESFGGYTWRYVPHALEARVRAAIPAALRSALFGTIGHLWPGSARLPRPLRLKTVFENLAVSDAEAFYRDLAWLRSDTRESLYDAGFLASLHGFTPMEVVQPHYARGDAPDALARAQHADVGLYMTDDVLAKVDRMSMAHALEVRCPLLDHRLLEFAARLPASLKIRAGAGKRVLRRAAARRLPRDIVEAPKRGFSVPAARWLRHELRELVEATVFHSPGDGLRALDGTVLRRLWLDHLAGTADHSVLFWGAMMLGLWEQARERRAPRTIAMARRCA